MRIPIVIANWKMHKTLTEARHFVAELLEKVSTPKYQIGLAIPYTLIDQCYKALSGTSIMVGSQNIHEKPSGAYTGEISAEMAQDAGAAFSLLGHSERRHYFSETNSIVCEKVKAAIAKNMIPVLCVGESLAEKATAQKVLEQQLSQCLGGLHGDQLKDLIVAYEPVWAIGTGTSATPAEANRAHGYIRSHLKKCYSQKFADQVRIIYGGSVQPNNVQSLMLQSNVDGLLVGGASLDASSFARIIFNLGMDV